MGKYIANSITGFRIACSIFMLCVPAASTAFFMLYLLCGVSDMADGTIARKTGSTSEFGARFDTVSDLIFVAVALVKLLPVLPVPEWLWIWIAAIAVIRLGNLILGFVCRKTFVALHTTMNRAAGLCLFLLPLTQRFAAFGFCCVAVCCIATAAAIQEGYYIQMGRMPAQNDT